MKKLLLLKSVLLLCALIVGSGSVWADDYEKYSGDLTEGDYLIVYSDCAMKNTVASDRLEYTAVTVSNNKVSSPGASLVWHIAPSGNYWTIYNSNVSKYAASTGAKNKAGLLADGTDNKALWTVTESSGTYEFINKQNAANNVNSNLRKNSTYGFACYATSTGGALTLYKKIEAAGEATTVTIDASGITNTDYASGTAAGSFTAVVKDASNETIVGATVTWSSSNTAVATIDASTGAVTLVAKGNTTITASYAGVDDTYQPSSASYTLNVTNSNANDGSLAKPFTVAEAIEFIEAEEYESTNYYVTGIVSQIGSISGEALTYYISDDGTTTNQLQVYKGMGLANSSFTSTSELSVNSAVIVYGPLYYYKSTTPEINAGSYIYSLNGVKTVTLTIADATNGTIAVMNGEDAVASGALLAGDAELTVTATPNTGYSFGGWSATSGVFDDESSASATLALDNADATLSATFTKNSYTLDVTSDHGTVNVTVDGEAWNGTDKIPYGASVSMTAVPAENYTFSEWDASLDEYNAITNPLEFTMPADDVLVEAKYLDANIDYTITINNVTGGTITADVDEAKAGATVTLSYELAEGYAFGEWSVVDANDNEVTVTNNQFTMPTSNVTVTASYNQVYTITWMVNGAQKKSKVIIASESLASEFPSVSSIGGMDFMGWVTTATVESDYSGSFVDTATETAEANTTYYAVFAKKTTSEIEDVLNREKTEVSGTSYSSWSGKTANSDAVYAGQSAGGNSSIQLRSDNNNSGVFTTTSGGKVKKIVIVWNSNTADGRTLNVYGKNSAYSAATELYNSSNQGTLLGTIVCGTSTELNVDGDYEYFGFRSKNGAMWLTSVTITWDASTYTDYCTTVTTSKDVTEFGYASYVAPYDVEFPAGRAFVVNEAETSVKLTEVTQVPAGTPVILKTEGTVTAAVLNETPDAPTTNLLSVGESTIPSGKAAWVLAKNGATAGFKKWTGEAAELEGRVVLLLDESLAREFMSFDDETTNIRSINNGQLTIDHVYNLAGQRIAQPTRGLYIVNGRKVVIR